MSVPPSFVQPLAAGAARHSHRLLGLLILLTVPACSPKATPPPAVTAASEKGVLLRVGSVEVREADLEQHLDDLHAGRRDPVARQKALDELARNAQLVQAAFAAHLENDPRVRAEVARVLANRVKEQQLYPVLKSHAASVPEARLRELYEANRSRYQANEKRQVAVLWLDPGKDPQRVAQYTEKLAAARTWLLESSDLQANPGKGFAELSVDYSEHQGSRYKGGVVGWLEKEGGMDAWTRALAEIVFSLAKPGDVSEVTARPEGVFLVRYMAETPALLRPFESVAAEIGRLEVSRLKQQAEAHFWEEMTAKYPIQRLTPPSAGEAKEKPPQEK
jgi:hypothetical protein